VQYALFSKSLIRDARKTGQSQDTWECPIEIIADKKIVHR